MLNTIHFHMITKARLALIEELGSGTRCQDLIFTDRDGVEVRITLFFDRAVVAPGVTVDEVEQHGDDTIAPCDRPLPTSVGLHS